MNRKNKPENQPKRVSLSKLRNVGVTSAVVASMGSGWMKPVINQVILPAHACTTDCTTTTTTTLPPECGTATVSATLGTCTGDGRVTIEIKATDSPLTMTSASVTADGWSGSGPSTVPAEFTDANPFIMIITGPVTDQISCFPANDVPNNGGTALTSIVVDFTYACEATGTTTSESVEVIGEL
jgi:hypothetical protein